MISLKIVIVWVEEQWIEWVGYNLYLRKTICCYGKWRSYQNNQIGSEDSETSLPNAIEKVVSDHEDGIQQKLQYARKIVDIWNIGCGPNI